MTPPPESAAATVVQPREAARAAMVLNSPGWSKARPESRPSLERAAAAARLVGDPRAGGGSAAAGVAVDDPGVESGRHLRVVERRELSPAQRRRRTRTLLVGGGVMLLMVGFGLVYFHVVLSERQVAVDNLTAQVSTQQATYERLRLQVAELGSPQNIISTAEGRLGMREPASVTYLTPKSVVAGATEEPSGVASPIGPSASAGAVTQAPAGDADWPQIKSQLAGNP